MKEINASIHSAPMWHVLVAITSSTLLLFLSGCASMKPSQPEPRSAPSPTVTTPTHAVQPVPNVQSATCGKVDAETVAHYRNWISAAHAKYPYTDSEELMFKVMRCESKCNAAIVNPAGPYSGLFQYSNSTWHADWNKEYRNESVLDPHAQIFATALAWSKNMQNQWGCYKKLKLN